MRTVPIVVSAAILALALAGCSTGSPSSTNSGGGTSGGGGGSAPVSSKTYSADDLVTILKKAQTTLGVKGTIQDDKALKAIIGKGTTGSITQQLAKEGAKFEPPACSALLDSLTKDASDFGEGTGGVGAELQYSSNILGISTSTTPGTPGKLGAEISKDMDSMATDCANMKLKMSVAGQSFSIGMSFKKAPATTNANQTYGYLETVDAGVTGAKATETASIVAVYGNLFISDTELTVASATTMSDLEKAINAVVAAAQ